MIVHKRYRFTGTTAGQDESGGVTTIYIADAEGGPYFSLQREFGSNLPQPEDLYIEYCHQGTSSYGSLKKLMLTRSRLEAQLENGLAIQIDLQITPEEWASLQAGFDQLLVGLESFILYH